CKSDRALRRYRPLQRLQGSTDARTLPHRKHARRTSVRKLAFALVAAASLAACTNAEKGAVVGGAGGAALGTLAGGNDVRNAIVGGTVGAIAGTMIGAANDHPGYCLYRDRNGRVFEARCRR